MKRAVSDKFQRAEYLTYYVFMVQFGIFLSYYSFKVHFTVVVFPMFALTISLLSGVIVYNFYKNVRLVERLLIPYITILLVLFIGSAIWEAVSYGFHWYVLTMKTALYFFCTFQQLLHFVQLKTKLQELNKK